MATVWIKESIVLALHEEHLAEHGGPTGVRDLGLLQSALARPRNAVAYANPDIPALAAAYGFGIARNHPFVDGNKRTAFVVTEKVGLAEFVPLQSSKLLVNQRRSIFWTLWG